MSAKEKGSLSLEAFKSLISTNKEFKKSFERSDAIDFKHGTATLYRENLMRQLEKFCCKNEEELVDTLYYKYGVFAKVID